MSLRGVKRAQIPRFARDRLRNPVDAAVSRDRHAPAGLATTEVVKKYLPITLLIILLGLAGYIVGQKNGGTINISGGQGDGKNNDTASNNEPKLPVSPISGLSCANGERRPMAVILAADAVARPLSGISEADLVFNMPVITDSMTRLMAVYVCGFPKEIGSVRSSRHDFIPLARGLDAIFVHWGGSHFALDELAKDAADNIDALKNPYNAFFRKSGIASPHNGFTSGTRLFEAAQKMGYRLAGNFGGYPHLAEGATSSATTTKTLNIAFPGSFAIKYVYDPEDNSYWRWRGGSKEIDKNTGQQVEAKNVAIMIAASRQIEGQYNDVDVEGSGQARIYRNGEEIIGTWKKDAAKQTSKLFFYDRASKEIKFIAGQIWVEVVQPNQAVSWK
ncbi:DUF3048 domain-containing protein [Patescibacteria group bacterium]|nr:DUF3048 domain-containing protein [Patescibacteria group bacterium]